MNLRFPDGSSDTYDGTGGGVKANATEDDLIDALAAMERGDLEYVILEDNASKMFMQAAGEARSGYDLEYNNGVDDSMFRAQGKISGAQVTDAFTAFLNRDVAWRTMFVWERFTY